MPLTVRVALGTVGGSITRVKLQTCTGADCTTCTDLSGYTDVPVSTFGPSGITISTIPDNALSVKVLALDTACSTTTQCLPIVFINQTTTTSTTSTTTTFQQSVQYCMGFALGDCCTAQADYYNNCGPF